LVAGAPSLAVRTGAAIRAASRRASQHPRPPAPFDAPLTPFSGRITCQRSYACTSVALDDVTAIKDAFACTVNDVVLTVTGGAIRAYLQGHGSLPSTSLTANVPISLRSQSTQRDWGNHLSEVFTCLHTDVVDPVARLRAVQCTMRLARRQHDAADRGLADAWWNCGPLVLGCTRLLRWLVRALSGRAPCSVIVANVRGPAQPLCHEGARLDVIHSMGLITDYVGLNVTAWSYVDRLSFGVVGCPVALGDAWELADRIPEQIAELRQRVGPARASMESSDIRPERDWPARSR
jgi:diacylglycerol O-acyltransferase / wax synthase